MPSLTHNTVTAKPRELEKLLTSRALGAARAVGALRHGPLAAGVHGELGGRAREHWSTAAAGRTLARVSPSRGRRVGEREGGRSARPERAATNQMG